MPLLPVLSPLQSAAWDARAERDGIALATLMEAAGRAAATVLLREFPHAARQGVLVAAGTGHNGGDGWVLARALHRLDVPVWVASLAGAPAPLTAHVAGLARAEGVREVAPDGPWPSLGLAVDAILGTGASGAPRAPAAALLERVLDLELPVLAIDGPTGLDLGTGVVHGVTRADVTVTFGGFRRGHLLARDEVGDLVVVDIGHPPVGIRHAAVRHRRVRGGAAAGAACLRPQGGARPRGGDRRGHGNERRRAPGGARGVRCRRRPGSRRVAARDDRRDPRRGARPADPRAPDGG